MSKHTPGPWMAKGATIVAQDPEHKNCLISLACTYGLSDFEESDANTRLIAAAPELLEMLEDACFYENFCGGKPPEQWLKVIAKVRGEE